MRRLLLIAAAAFVASATPAHACTSDDQAYFDSFPDATCLLTQTQTEVDTLGGVRLVTDGDLVSQTWDTQAQFEADPERSLAITGAANPSDPAAALTLPETTLPLGPTGPVFSPAPSSAPDNDRVDDPSVIRVDAQYVMYYTGTPEDGSDPQIMRATSSDGRAWTRGGAGNTPQTVVSGGDAGAFDEHGVFGPDVIYDAEDEDAPYRMYFSGRGDVFTQIGYASSADGITWTKRATPVVPVGLPGSRDSFSVAQPDVIFDSSLWKMWYEGDDSTKKSIGYATSLDGITWSRGGTVIEPEDAPGGLAEFGVFAPTVTKIGDTFHMLLGGRNKDNQDRFSTKLLGASSTDGITWSQPSTSIPQAGSGFDSANLNSPDVLQDPSDAAAPYKLYYSGDRSDTGDPHTRIGLATSTNGTNWNRFDGAATGDSVFDISPAGTAFDARSVADLTMTSSGGTPPLTGAYTGRNESGLPRLGLVTSTDGVAITRLTGAGEADDGSVVALGNGNAFDADGHEEPSLLRDPNASANDDWFLYFTGLATDGTRTIGVSATQEDAQTQQPAGPWSNASQVLDVGATFDASGVSHPSVIKDGPNAYVMYYTGHNGTTTTIARATSTSPTTAFANRAAVTFSGTDACAPQGALDPVVIKLDGEYRMLYTGRFASGLERVCYATSADGTQWAPQGAVLNPSLAPFAFDEVSVAPSGFVADGGVLRVYTTGTDKLGRTRAGAATSPLPTPATPEPAVPTGWATYQYGDATSAAQDFRSIEQVSTGTGVELWMSVLQPYANDEWSAFFPVLSAAGTADLNFDLGVKAVRIRVRESGPAGNPSLDKIVLNHAPVRFAASGEAVTTDIAPPDGFVLQSWTSMTVASSLLDYGAGTAAGTVSVLDAADNSEVVAPTALTPGSDTVVSLAGVSAAEHPRLRVRFALTSSHEQVTALINSVRVTYAAAEPTATPTVTPSPTPVPEPPTLSLTARPKTIVFGKTATLSGLVVRGYAPIAGAAVVLTQQPRGATAFAPLATVTTGTDGTYSRTVKPTKRTTYAAATEGATSPPPVTVKVKHRLTLKVRVRGRKLTFKGAIGPKHGGRRVKIQRKVGKRWKAFTKAKTNRRSTYTKVVKVSKGRYTFRARTGADADHLAGKSPARKVRVR